MKLFVGHLPYDVTDEELKEMFEKFGTVKSAKVILDRDTGRSRGFGFVEMERANDAQSAIDALNGSDVHGRTIAVNPAKEKTEGGGGGGRPSYPRKNTFSRRY